MLIWPARRKAGCKETDRERKAIMWKSALVTLVTRASGVSLVPRPFKVFKQFGKRPLFYSTVITGSLILYDYASWKLSMWWQQNKIITTIRKGCVPCPPKLSYVCERNQLVQALYTKVLHPPEAGFFRVVVGPLGCGKTFCVTTAIRKNKQVSIVICVIFAILTT